MIGAARRRDRLLYLQDRPGRNTTSKRRAEDEPREPRARFKLRRTRASQRGLGGCVPPGGLISRLASAAPPCRGRAFIHSCCWSLHVVQLLLTWSRGSLPALSDSACGLPAPAESAILTLRTLLLYSRPHLKYPAFWTYPCTSASLSPRPARSL
jgi:hypothetical protein